MKKRASIVLALLLTCCLCACAQKNEIAVMQPTPTQTQALETEMPEPVVSEAPGMPEAGASRILIAYFSLGRNAGRTDGVDATTSASLVIQDGNAVGTTEAVARMIQADIGGDLHLIQTATPYPYDFQAVVDQNHKEMNAGFLPALVESDLDVSQYDTVFIGYPVWATNAPQAIFPS